ncbi:MAG: septum formation protein Maf [Kordiimonadaceae bacterium]|nr:septum formation protein Maf [Kordiimonadaceae bacterium]MBO6568355.1 septum formation protein Maf [Kordiimonadaceae bacterium]MBO6963916.1 septum formation protein Maf [Kordiimonadaceae bacterium]
MPELILASKSQTRQAMLVNAGIEFDAQSAPVDEAEIKASLVADGVSARDIADALADAKARAVSMMNPDALVLGADQILVQDGEIFSKAANRDEAKSKLMKLSGNRHQLISAAVMYEHGQAIWRAVDSATLHVRELSDGFIEEYLDALGEDAYWSVGCYQIEGRGIQLFEKVSGSHFTILGLPLLAVIDFLRRRGMVST